MDDRRSVPLVSNPIKKLTKPAVDGVSKALPARMNRRAEMMSATGFSRANTVSPLAKTVRCRRGAWRREAVTGGVGGVEDGGESGVGRRRGVGVVYSG